jgi:hypothetical protein
VPRDPALRCDGWRRHPFEAFKRAFTAEFLPNCVLGLLKTDQAFHGVEPIGDQGTERNVLLYNIYVREAAPGRASRRRLPPGECGCLLYNVRVRNSLPDIQQHPRQEAT